MYITALHDDHTRNGTSRRQREIAEVLQALATSSYVLHAPLVASMVHEDRVLIHLKLALLETSCCRLLYSSVKTIVLQLGKIWQGIVYRELYLSMIVIVMPSESKPLC